MDSRTPSFVSLTQGMHWILCSPPCATKLRMLNTPSSGDLACTPLTCPFPGSLASTDVSLFHRDGKSSIVSTYWLETATGRQVCNKPVCLPLRHDAKQQSSRVPPPYYLWPQDHNRRRVLFKESTAWLTLIIKTNPYRNILGLHGGKGFNGLRE